MSIDVLYAIMTNPVERARLHADRRAPPTATAAAASCSPTGRVGMALDATPPVVTPAISPAAPDGANGWYRGPVTVTWSVSDAESPVTARERLRATTPRATA